MRFWLKAGGWTASRGGRDLAPAQGRPVPRQSPRNPALPAGSAAGPTRVIPVHTTDQPESARGHRGTPAGWWTSFPDRVLIGEIYLPIDRLVNLLRPRSGGGAHLPFNFSRFSTRRGRRGASPRLIDLLRGGRCRRAGWPNWVLGQITIGPRNRRPRRPGAGAHRGDAGCSRCAGTPTIYYGDEIGMPAGAHPDRTACCVTRSSANVPGIGCGPGRGLAPPCSGMPTAERGLPPRGEPWLPVAAGYARRTTSEREAARPGRRCSTCIGGLIAARRRLAVAAASGNYRPIAASGGPVTVRFASARAEGAPLVGFEPGRATRFPVTFPGGQLLGEVPGYRAGGAGSRWRDPARGGDHAPREKRRAGHGARAGRGGSRRPSV